jgi:phenylpropionate dioxygenase-like ring-hydroxylating dioxygenase large terminal subunit
MLLGDHWYVACPSSQLASTPKAVVVGDLDLVLFRDARGAAHALLDRCCHRGVKLSLGRITDGRIACGYHGWQYDGAGNLVHVPSLGAGDELPRCSTPTFPVVEKDFYVWVWIAGKSQAPTYQPAIVGIGNRRWIQQTAHWNANIMDAVENQLDVAHTPFSHPGIYPGHGTEDGVMPPLRQIDVECRVVGGGVELHMPPAPTGAEVLRPWHELGVWVRFELPYRNYVFLVREKTLAIYNWVPIANGTCRLEFMAARYDPDAEAAYTAPSATFQDTELKLLSQDRILLESAKPWIDRGRREFEKSVPQDFPQLLARRLHRAAVQGRLAELKFDKPRVFATRA